MLLQYPLHVPQSLRSPPKPRLSLRERCRVSFTVQTAPFNESPETQARIYQTLEPRKNNLPRRSVRVRVPTPPPYPIALEDVFDTPDAGPSDYLTEKSHLEEIIHGLFVAFADDDFEAAALRTYEHREFSHIVQVTLGPEGEVVAGRGEETLRYGIGTQKLRLSCPTERSGDGPTVLSSDQLLAARDFLSLAMPYSNYKLPFMPKSHCDVKLLVVAPRDRTVDAISIVVCYLAFASGKPAATVLQYINEVEEFDVVWKGDTLGLDGMDFVEKVARRM
ncbi:hypothetical protein PAXRUDRAFT_135930 [Paxillus rubicundulus Ve08.2h10]|uniref:Uncharacterized protein n=1 Tax=Paxillus rubicundulus Ve08.2h10 TaxID=930991 RepID=A0A0D0EBH6_9AGAM|nr:hypothetical protein PAXRUDRAFT_135930 [Paxillus rubicundulus Ve08.2h10]